ncbi:GreA/GreB family elongation factor [Candidatus Parcubacteria bacterium]|nr:GreA/GreB family elongation factor [Candidatus Parcubacteria bacterium]
MRTPIRKPGKYTDLKKDANITKKKYLELKTKLEKLIKYSRPTAIKEVKRLALDGDFSENHAYSMAKGRLRGINQRIDEIEDILKRAVIIEPRKNTETTRLGQFVTVETGGKTKTYQILGSAETDPEKNIISHLSPLGSALMGKKRGDIISLKIKNNIKEYKILKIK